jgi:hypothetical protein
LDGDGTINNFDIGPFEQALTNSAGFLISHPAIRDFTARGDINDDGTFNNFDIGPFESLLSAGASPVPEPSTFVLLAIGAGVAAVRPWRRQRSDRDSRTSSFIANSTD